MERYFEDSKEQKSRVNEFNSLEKETIRESIEKLTIEEIKTTYKHLLQGKHRGKYSSSQLKSKECIQMLADYEFDQKFF